MTMNVIIPLAGFGTRLRPHTFTKPKPLINVAGKPVLGHILDKLTLAGVTDVAFVVGYLGEQIESYVAKQYPSLKAHYATQKELNGQAPAVLLTKPYVSGPTMIVFVDTLADADLSALQNETADGVIYVKEVEDPRRFGVVSLDDQGFITKFIEKPDNKDNKLVVIGMYWVKDAARLMQACEDLVHKNIQTKGEYYLADAFNQMIAAGAKLRIQRVDMWLDCGKPETVLETNRVLLGKGQDNSAFWAGRPDVVIVPPVNIHPTAKVSQSVIGPNATIGEECEITLSVIRDSVVDSGAQVREQVLAGSLIGRDAIVAGRPRRLNVGDSSVIGFEEEGEGS